MITTILLLAFVQIVLWLACLKLSNRIRDLQQQLIDHKRRPLESQDLTGNGITLGDWAEDLRCRVSNLEKNLEE